LPTICTPTGVSDGDGQPVPDRAEPGHVRRLQRLRLIADRIGRKYALLLSLTGVGVTLPL